MLQNCLTLSITRCLLLFNVLQRLSPTPAQPFSLTQVAHFVCVNVNVRSPHAHDARHGGRAAAATRGACNALPNAPASPPVTTTCSQQRTADSSRARDAPANLTARVLALRRSPCDVVAAPDGRARTHTAHTDTSADVGVDSSSSSSTVAAWQP